MKYIFSFFSEFSPIYTEFLLLQIPGLCIYYLASLMFYFSLLFSAQISSRSRSLCSIYYLHLFSGLNNIATFIIMQLPLSLRSLRKIFSEIGSNKIPYKLLNNLIHFDSLEHTFLFSYYAIIFIIKLIQTTF